MAVPEITVACWDYDRTRALLDGRVAVAGASVRAVQLPPEELFPRAVTTAEFDVTEISAASQLIQVFRGEGAYVAIPAPVSRAFRHGAIYVGEGSGIRDPKDLDGRLVGVPEYQMTMAVWVRGLLADEYGVETAKLRYRTGGLNVAGRKERLELRLPAHMDVAPIAADETLNGLLLGGALDAVIAPAPPAGFIAGDGRVRRLIGDAPAAERDYYRRTGIFPIMHLIGVRRTLAERYPDLPGNVFRAFVEARRRSMDEIDAIIGASANRVSLPWFAAEVEATRKLMGADFAPYGFDENRRDLETFCRYAHQQHLTERRMQPEELFDPATLEMTGA